jgi:hypothetical protein
MTGDLPPDETEGDPTLDPGVFHYNRDRRLASAPENVQKAYRDGYTPNKGFIRGLTANAGLRSILFVIVVLCVVIGAVTFLGDAPGAKTVNGVNLSLKAFLYEETVYVTLSAEAGESVKSLSIPVEVTLNGLDADGSAVSTATLSGVLSGKKLSLRTTMPDYDIQKVSATIKLGKTDSSLLVSVDRK